MKAYVLLLVCLLVACTPHGNTSPNDDAGQNDKVTERPQTDANDEARMNVGCFAPNFYLPRLNAPNTYASLPQGDTCLIMFWASWCPDCHAAMPHVNAFLKQHNDIKLTSISLDSKAEDAISYLKNNPMAGDHLCDGLTWKSDAAKAYAVHEIPQFYLIAPNGILLYKGGIVEEMLK